MEQSASSPSVVLEHHSEPDARVGPLLRWLGPDNERLLRGLLGNPPSRLGVALLACFFFVAVAAPVLAPPAGPDPYLIPRDGFRPEPQPPGSAWLVRPPPLPFWWQPLTGLDRWVHPFGTASGQWDIYYGLVWGTRTAFKVGVVITLITLSIGVIVGSLAGYYGGLVDMILMRLTDVFLAFPFLVAALTFSAVLIPVFGRGIYPAMIALSVFGWMGYARILRGDILAIKERDFVLAVRALGASDYRIVTRHILPNAIFPTLVVASLDIGTYVLGFAALSFLGVGVDAGYADWGQLIAFARNWITQLSTYWYVLFFPGLAIVLFVLSWTLIGDTIRDIFDPRLQGRGQV